MSRRNAQGNERKEASCRGHDDIHGEGKRSIKENPARRKVQRPLTADCLTERTRQKMSRRNAQGNERKEASCRGHDDIHGEGKRSNRKSG
jgi:hypothetical protein